MNETFCGSLGCPISVSTRLLFSTHVYGCVILSTEPGQSIILSTHEFITDGVETGKIWKLHLFSPLKSFKQQMQASCELLLNDRSKKQRCSTLFHFVLPPSYSNRDQTQKHHFYHHQYHPHYYLLLLSLLLLLLLLLVSCSSPSFWMSFVNLDHKGKSCMPNYHISSRNACQNPF